MRERRSTTRPDPRGTEAALASFRSETAALIAIEASWSLRFTVLLLSGLVGAFLLFAWLLPFDRVVTARGRLAPETPTIVVQPLETSIIRNVEVRAGQVVRKGELLARLDPTFSTADATQLEQRVASLSSEIARLESELTGAPVTARGTPVYDEMQQAIAGYREAQFQAMLARFAGRTDAILTTKDRSVRDIEHYKSRLVLLGEIEAMRQKLERQEVGSRLSSLLATDTRIEIARNLAGSESAMRSAEFELVALHAEREVYLQQWKAKIAEDLAARRVELDRAREELSKAAKIRDLVELRAVDDAIVLEVAPVSQGSVLRSAEKLMTLVPLDAELQVEADISAADQGFVKPGHEVRIKLDAYRYVEHGTAKGRVRSISADSFVPSNPDRRGVFYRAYIDLEDTTLRGVPADFQLVPGMPLGVDIVVGSRTLLSYFLEGMLRTGAEGLREP